jgi:hypothetical protein
MKKVIESFEDFFIQKDENRRKIVQDVKEILLDLCDYGIFPIVIKNDKGLSIVIQRNEETSRLSNSGDAHKMHVWNTSYANLTDYNIFTYENIKDRVDHLIAYMYDKQNKLISIRVNNFNYSEDFNLVLSGDLEKDISYIENIIKNESSKAHNDIRLLVLTFKLNTHKY